MPDLTPDWTVVGYALVLALLCTIAVTLGPALRTWRQQLLPFLKVGEQSVVQARSRLSRGLVVLQLAFSVLLLTTAGLAQRSLSLQDSADVGFNTRNLLLATVNTSASADDAKGNRAAGRSAERTSRAVAGSRRRILHAGWRAVWDVGTLSGAARSRGRTSHDGRKVMSRRIISRRWVSRSSPGRTSGLRKRERGGA